MIILVSKITQVDILVILKINMVILYICYDKEFKENLPSTINDPLATEKSPKFEFPSDFTRKCNSLVSI